MEITPPAVPENNQPAAETPEVVPNTPEQDDQEWGNAETEVFGEQPKVPEVQTPPSEQPNLENPLVPPTTPEVKKEDPAQPPATPETPKTGEEPKTPDNQPPAAPATPTTPIQDLETVAQRIMARNNQAAIETHKSEIKAKIMPELPEMKANDGFVIKSAKDLETVEDPRTPGKAFTPEEAQRVFGEFQQGVQKIQADAEARATQIATVNQGLHDEATLALAAFKDIFSENPQLQKSMFEAYSKTLKVSPEGFIEDAPVSLLEFYNAALSPYMKQQQAQQAAAPASPAQPSGEPADNSKRHQDRSDIYKPSGSTLSKEDQEWADAARDALGV